MTRPLAALDAEVPRLKLMDAETPGFVAELDPDEAEIAGAFVEDALDEESAHESAGDASTLEPLP